VTANAESIVEATPDVVFTALTDLARLPSWNHRMTSVVETPAELRPGAEWVVEFRVLGRTWRSRSTLEELDTARRRFVYRSRTDDGNPSEARWEWNVTEHPSGARVHVAWALHPVTFWRRTLLVRMRARQLARTELPESLAALAAMVTADDPTIADRWPT
jgi:uncharacterized protein YndB with AHSA1/START domain